ncbi:efflux RND transporter periplasmic adaptor subunit [Roseibium aggregatum]|uniref:efflux RND transporter periplasmic adaptor subunit n=1 Tax=Roseibium aggregatum TaxID=187304 RepID=UPI003A96C93F
MPYRPCLVAAILAGGLLAGCTEEEKHVEAPRPVLSTIAALQLPAGSEFSGTVAPRYTTDLGFQVLGRMISRNVNVGDIVKKGDLIGQLDPAIYEFAERAAEANLSAAEAQLANAMASEKRAASLVKSGIDSIATLDSAEQTRKSAEATVSSARAELEKAREQLSYTRLIATFDGVVTEIDVNVGDVVAAGETILTLARLDAKDAIVDIPEDLIAQFKGRTFEVTLQAFQAPPVTAHIREIAPRADSVTRSLRIRMTLETPPPSFRLGALVTARPVGIADETITLPQTALLEEGGKTYVWIVNEDTATVHKVPIEIAKRSNDDFIVASGLKPGERVVTAGVHSLTEAQEVALGSERKI